MTTIELGNVQSEDQAKKLVEKLNGKTYYNFSVQYGTYAGNYPVTVTTEYEGAKKKEVKSMLMFVMACEM